MLSAKPSASTLDFSCCYGEELWCGRGSHAGRAADGLYLQVSILDSEEVCVELLREMAGQEYVKEVLQVSRDGTRVCMCLALLPSLRAPGSLGSITVHRQWLCSTETQMVEHSVVKILKVIHL